VAMRRSAGGHQFHCGRDADADGQYRSVQSKETGDNGTTVLQWANGCQVCRCAQARKRWPKSLEHRHRCTEVTGYTAGTKPKLKAEVCGGRRGPSSPRRFPFFLGGGRPRGRRRRLCVTGASACRRGALLPRVCWWKATSEGSAVDSRRPAKSQQTDHF
jgi:hypothetical protein